MSVRKNGKIIAGTTVSPDLFDFKWADHILNDVSWLRADTFSWQRGAVYEAAYNHLVADLNVLPAIVVTDGETYPIYTRYASGDVSDALHPYCWKNSTEGNVYTTQEDPPVGNNKYAFTTATGSVVAGYIYNKGTRPGAQQQTETIAGITITYYLAADKHKIVLPNQESNVVSIYNAIGVAWYYILDTANQRFKLPRTKFNAVGLRDTVEKNTTVALEATGYPKITTTGRTSIAQNTDYTLTSNCWVWWGSSSFNGRKRFYVNGIQLGMAYGVSNAYEEYNSLLIPLKAGNVVRHEGGNSLLYIYPTESDNLFATQQYLYFYVGNFTRTALQNTAGVVTEDFNELNAHKVIAFQAPNSGNNHTWYRKYADGWVEQGGHQAATSSNGVQTVNLVVQMADTNYFVQKNWYAKGTAYTNASYDATASVYTVSDKTPSSFTTYNLDGWNGFDWEVKGIAA